jgi:trigger factor
MSEQTKEKKLYTNLKVGKADKGDVEIEAEIPAEVIDSFVSDVIAHAAKDIELPGFRKGQVPAELAKKHLNEMHVLEDAADLALREVYPQILEDENLDVVTAPRVTVTKLAPGNPVSFKARVGIAPVIKLPDYKKIGAKIKSKEEKVEVTDAEIDGTIRNIQMMRMNPAELQVINKDGTPASADGVTPPKEIKLPELTDEYVKTLGQFESVADFKAKLKTSIEEEKSSGAKQVTREKIAEELIKETPFSLPAMLVDEEVALLKDRRAEEIDRLKITPEEYLKKIGKTESELDKEEQEYVERQLKTRFIIEKIAQEEKIIADDKEVKRNSEYLMERNANADPESVQRYVAAMLTNEKVLELLEGSAEESKEEARETKETK